MVSIATLREAFEIISAAACGATPALIRVVVPTTQEPRTFIVALPSECRASVYAYLADRIDLAIPVAGEPLILTAVEAAAVLRLAIEVTAVKDAVA